MEACLRGNGGAVVTLEDDDLLLQRRHLHPEFAAVLGLLRQRVLQLLDLHNVRSVRISSAVPLHLPVQGTAPWSAQCTVSSPHFSRLVRSTCSRYSSLICTMYDQPAHLISAIPLDLPVHGTVP